MERRDWREKPRATREEIAADLRQLGLGSGAVVLVHSSLSRIGHVVGGAEAVVDALLDAVAPGGTVLFPTLTGAREDGPQHPPKVELAATPCWTGRIPETARQRREAVRSRHPTHSVAAIGASAERFASEHELSETPCDRRSPYYRLIDEGGYILLLGTTQHSNTTLHCLEELAATPYHLQDGWTDGLVDGQVVRNRLHLWRWRRDFPKADGALGDAFTIGRVGHAETRLFSARALHDALLPLMRADPLYLMHPDARREYLEGAAP